MKYFQAIVASIILVFVIGCSEDKPTKADLEAAVISSFPQCTMLVITDVKMENGQKKGDSSYAIRTNYQLEIVPTPEIKTFYDRMISDNEEIQKLKEEYTSKADEAARQAHELRKKNAEEIKEYYKTKSVLSEEFSDNLWKKYGQPAEALSKEMLRLNSEYLDVLRQRKLKEYTQDEIYKFAVTAFMKTCPSPSLKAKATALSLINGVDKDEVIERLVSGYTEDADVIIDFIKTDKGWVTQL